MQDARAQLQSFHSRVRITVDNPPPVSGSGFGGSELRIDIRGAEQAQLERAAAKLRHIMEATPGVVDIDSTVVAGKPEVQLVIHRDRAADLGVRLSYAGVEHTTVPDPVAALATLPPGKVDVVANYTAFHALRRRLVAGEEA